MSYSEEVDRIIFHKCNDLKCSFVEESDNVVQDATSNPENAFEFIIRCLWRLDPQARNEFPSFKIPSHISSRFQFASSLSTYMKKHKVRAEVDFQNLLYGSAKNYKNIFIDLIQKLPSISIDDILTGSPLEEAVRRSVSNQDSEWVPLFCRLLKMKRDGRFWCPGDRLPERKNMSSVKSKVIKDSRDWISEILREGDEEKKTEKPILPRKPKLLPKPGTLISTETEEVGSNELDTLTEQFALLKNELDEAERNTKLENKILYDLKSELELIDPRIQEFLYGERIQAEQNVTAKITETENAITNRQAFFEFQFKKDEEEIAELSAQAPTSSRLFTKIESNEKEIETLQDVIAQSDQFISKMEKALNQSRSRTFDILERKCFELEGIVLKHEKEIGKIESDNFAQLKSNTRSWDKLLRLFDEITVDLEKTRGLRRGRQVVVLFHRFMLLCIESNDMIKQKGRLNADIEASVHEFNTIGEQKYEERCAALLRDLQAFKEENPELASIIDQLEVNS